MDKQQAVLRFAVAFSKKLLLLDYRKISQGKK